MKLPFKKLHPDAKVPTYGTDFSAGADLSALLDSPVHIAPGETVLIHTGISLAIPDGYVGLIFARSGLASKRGLAPANKVGVIDSDYRGELMIALYNHSSETKIVEPEERVAQLAVVPYARCEYEEAQSLCRTSRGNGGFGSTGMK